MNAHTRIKTAPAKSRTAFIKGGLYFDTRSRGWFIYDEFKVFEFGGVSQKMVMAASTVNAEGSGRVTVPHSNTTDFFESVMRDYAHERLLKAVDALYETGRGKKLVHPEAIKEVTREIRPGHYCQDPVVLAKALVKIVAYIDSNRGENGAIGTRFNDMFEAFDQTAYTLGHFMRLTYGTPVAYVYNDLRKIFLTTEKRANRAERIAECFTYGEDNIILGESPAMAAKISAARNGPSSREAPEETSGVDIRDCGNFRLRFFKNDKRYPVHILGKEGRSIKLLERPYRVLEFLLKDENRGREIARDTICEKLGMTRAALSQASVKLEACFKEAFTHHASTIFQASRSKTFCLALPGSPLKPPSSAGLPAVRKLPRFHASKPRAVKRRVPRRVKAPDISASTIVDFGAFKLRVIEGATTLPASLMDGQKPEWPLSKRAYNLLTLMDEEKNRGKPISPSVFARAQGVSMITAYLAAQELKEAFAAQYPRKVDTILRGPRGSVELLVHSLPADSATARTDVPEISHVFERASTEDLNAEMAMLKPAPGLKEIFKVAADMLNRAELLSLSNLFMRDERHQMPEDAFLQKLGHMDRTTMFKQATAGQARLAKKLTEMFMALTPEARDQARQVQENWGTELRRRFTI